MGLVYANVELLNATDVDMAARHQIGEDEIRHLEISCMVDTGAVMLIINEEIRATLGLTIRGIRQSRLADKRPIELPVAGPVEVRYEGRFCTTNALVLPGEGEPLLGAIPMEEMDLWVNPNRQMLNPVHPEGPVMMLKGVQ
ncbi:MAG: hypothetical protein H7246_22535 [Phycisphaerae bacterium]|nr:hypothetical protein [Saprospiraceae bacterium]